MARCLKLRAGAAPTILVVSPALRYGSWSWFEDLIKASSDLCWVIVGYGPRPIAELPNATFLTLPGGDYLRIGRLAARPALLWLNFLYVLPLVLISAVLVRLKEPVAVVGNGIAAAGLLSISCLGRRRRRKVWLAYHGAIGHLPATARVAIRALLRPVAGAVCNSSGNQRELKSVMPSVPILSVCHWADEVFFSGAVCERATTTPLRILYVGRTDPEKFGQCFRVCQRLAVDGLVELTVVGSSWTPPYPSWMVHRGYVSVRVELKRYYEQADLTWAPADVDYLSRPGTEALASGCPLIVSDVPAVSGKCDGGVRIPRDLIPRSVGVVVDGTDDTEAVNFIRSWVSSAATPFRRLACREFAMEHFSPTNLESILTAWRS